MMSKLKTSVILAALLVTACFMALAGPQKTEIVYAKLDGAGSVSGVYVVNVFESDEKANITDYGDYEKTVNLSRADAIKTSGKETTFSMEPGRFLYQGNMKSAEIPWDIKSEYALNGKPVSAEELSGAEGELTIKLGIHINEAMKSYADSMVLQISLSLPSENALNIEAEGALKAYAGTNITLSYMVLPGMEAEYSVSASVKDFYMPSLQIAGVKMAMDSEMLTEYVGRTLSNSPVQQLAENMIKNMLGDTEKPLSFADKRNGEISGLQFVIMNDGIPEKPKPRVEIPDDKEKSLWDKIKDLF